MSDLEREDGLLRKISPTVEEVEAHVRARDFESALMTSMQRLVVLSLMTFREEGLQFEQSDNVDIADHDFALVVTALATAARRGLDAFEGQPPDRLIAAAGVLTGMDQLLRVLAGEYPSAGGPDNHMAAVVLAAVDMGHMSMMLGHERLGFAEKASMLDEKAAQHAASLQSATRARVEKADRWRTALDRFATTDLLAAQGENKAVADLFRQDYKTRTGRDAPKSNLVEQEVAAIRQRRRDGLH